MFLLLTSIGIILELGIILTSVIRIWENVVVSLSYSVVLEYHTFGTHWSWLLLLLFLIEQFLLKVFLVRSWIWVLELWANTGCFILTCHIALATTARNVFFLLLNPSFMLLNIHFSLSKGIGQCSITVINADLVLVVTCHLIVFHLTLL